MPYFSMKLKHCICKLVVVPFMGYSWEDKYLCGCDFDFNLVLQILHVKKDLNWF